MGDKIGQGQYGCVYKAFNMKDGTFVAVKQIDKEYIPGKFLPELKVIYLLIFLKFMKE
jgi:hypothetical protein